MTDTAKDTYRTVTQSGTGQYTEKRSRFIAFANHADSEEEAMDFVAQLKNKYHDARHVCYAYIVGNTGEAYRQNDDGEPSGTGGRPILGQLHSFDLTYTVVAVVRYFGGVKLGPGPLAVAYKTATAEALGKCRIEEVVVKARFSVSLPYADADVAMRYVRSAGGEVVPESYSENGPILSVTIRQKDAQALRDKLSNILSLKFV